MGAAGFEPATPTAKAAGMALELMPEEGLEPQHAEVRAVSAA
jgi:hypothetical protein